MIVPIVAKKDTPLNIAAHRLLNQHIAGTKFEKPADVVGWLGAVQAQDYPGSLWAVGLRMQNAVEADVEQALADRTIIRTWPLRSTLHFVTAADVRWMLDLLTPRIISGWAGRYRQLDLDEATFVRSKKLFVRALQGGRQLTRPQLYQLLEKAKISTGGQRGIHILARLSRDGLICFGARQGKQQTFALLEEWAPKAKTLRRDDALAELARRYFTSHGPATLQDFVWWSGLTMGEARSALEMVKSGFLQEVIGSRTYWFSSSLSATVDGSPTVYLLPPYDEYTVGYTDRTAVLNPKYAERPNYGNGIFYPTIVINGQVAGTWKRTLKKDTLLITPSPFARLSKRQSQAFAAAAGRYGEFLRAPLRLGRKQGFG